MITNIYPVYNSDSHCLATNFEFSWTKETKKQPKDSATSLFSNLKKSLPGQKFESN